MGESHVRIDEGIKRGPRKIKPAKLPPLKLKPSDVENEQRAESRRIAQDDKGRIISLYTPEQRQQAVTDALQSLESGLTVADIAKLHNIAPSTLHSWLIADNRAIAARTLYYSRQIANALEKLDTAETPLELARGRELHRAWITTASVRDHAAFGAKQQLQVDVNQHVTIDAALSLSASSLLEKVRNPALVIDGEGGVQPSLETKPPTE